MDVSLSWGGGSVTLKVSQENVAGWIKPRTPRLMPPGEAIKKALDQPMGESLEDLSRGSKVCVLVEDDTRSEPHEEIIEQVCSRLRGAAEVWFIVCTGSHDPGTEGNLGIRQAAVKSSRRHGLKLRGVFINDSFSGDFDYVGTTERETRVLVNKAAAEADLFVVGADMKNHYFAGYSNALKDFLPGICAYDCIEANHSLALDVRSTFGQHPLHPDPSRRENPVAEDMLEAERMICEDRPVFVLATISSHGSVAWCASGPLEEVTGRGIREVDRLTSFEVDQVSHVVVSPGGYPQDDSLYNSQRALELTKNAISDGGEALLLAECSRGIAPNEKAMDSFYRRLTKPIDEVLAEIGDKYVLYSHKAYKFAQLLKRLKSVSVYTNLDRRSLEMAHLKKAEDAQAVIDRWLTEDRNAKIMFFDDANKIALYSRGHAPTRGTG